MGYQISFDEKYIIHLIYEGLQIEVRAPWTQILGKMIHNHYDFSDPLYISYEEIVKETFTEIVENS